ncbi:glutathione peroxidase [Fuerstiella marisgermanici]|uniref:Glutathione peroxidase n=1 Tax=Fuerstiella marisgermanici TaxID=1891926 RepID=A0A1P8WPV9_9PLAN|nr:glutathione peroxidase [Fuerstiella marisgermanici]APZ96092.1 hypothetical protein Fuma_05760 [Fuerstiella marisgermanici]
MKLFSLAALTALMIAGANGMADDEKQEAKTPDSVHDFKVKSLDGKEVELEKYKGKVLLVVNVASQCGATPQYTQLQELHDKYADKGLVVMGFPCNQFGAQEPGSAEEIKEFCSTKYRVKFPMFSKIDVNGDEQAPIYDFLKSNSDDHTNIGWNFEKFIVSKDGKVAARFKTRTKPNAPEVLKILEEELAK